MITLNNNNIVVEPTHEMASSNTKSNYIFRLANGNYISRKAYVQMVVDKGLISHRYLSPNESRWVMSAKAGN